MSLHHKNTEVQPTSAASLSTIKIMNLAPLMKRVPLFRLRVFVVPLLTEATNKIADYLVSEFSKESLSVAIDVFIFNASSELGLN